MVVSVRGHDLSLSDALETHTRRRLDLALGGIARYLNEVEVRIADVNGPRGGVDKRCTIKVALRRVGVVVARATGTDAYLTVDRAAERIRTVVTRRLTRRRDGRASGPGASRAVTKLQAMPPDGPAHRDR